MDEVRDFLLEVEVYDHLEKIVKKNQLSSDRLEEFLDLTDAVIDGRAEISQMPDLIAQAFGIDDAKAKMVAADVAGVRLLPLSEFIEGVENAIKSWGGDIDSYPSLRIKKPGVGDDIRDYAHELGLELPDHLMKRFVYLTGGYIKKERDREGTMTLLKRPMNIGGLELKDEQVNRLLTMLDERFVEDQQSEQELIDHPEPAEPVKDPVVETSTEEIKSVESEPVESEPVEEVKDPEPVEVVKEVKKTTRTREMLPIKAVPHALTTDVPVISGHLFDHEADEVARHAQELQKKGLHENEEHHAKRGGVVDEVLVEVLPIFKNAKQNQKTAQSIVEGFVRGRIDKHRADSLLQEKYGMSAEQAHNVIAILQKGYSELHKAPVQKPVAQKPSIPVKEKSVLDERHAALTSSVPKESIEPVMPSARISAARTKEQELEAQSQKIDQEKLKQAQVKARPKKAKIRLSGSSVPPKRQVEPVAKVADVKKVEKLIGPVEELGTMGIAEFRRLSSDPGEAVEKMLGTLELLQEAEYEERIKGVRAWRKSPLSKLYINLVQEALSKGMTVADAAAERRNAGQESLSGAEIEAIVNFNKKISF